MESTTLFLAKSKMHKKQSEKWSNKNRKQHKAYKSYYTRQRWLFLFLSFLFCIFLFTSHFVYSLSLFLFSFITNNNTKQYANILWWSCFICKVRSNIGHYESLVHCKRRRLCRRKPLLYRGFLHHALAVGCVSPPPYNRVVLLYTSSLLYYLFSYLFLLFFSTLLFRLVSYQESWFLVFVYG